MNLNMLSFVSNLKLERVPPGNVGTRFNNSGRDLVKAYDILKTRSFVLQ